MAFLLGQQSDQYMVSVAGSCDMQKMISAWQALTNLTLEG